MSGAWQDSFLCSLNLKTYSEIGANPSSGIMTESLVLSRESDYDIL